MLFLIWDGDSNLELENFRFSPRMGFLPRFAPKWGRISYPFGACPKFSDICLFINFGEVIYFRCQNITLLPQMGISSPFAPHMGTFHMFLLLREVLANMFCFFLVLGTTKRMCLGCGVIFQSPVGGQPSMSGSVVQVRTRGVPLPG